MATPSISEIRDFHPLVAKWLETNGYSFQHELKIKGGKIDFLATKNNRQYIIECKTEKIKTRHILQLLGYCADMPNTSPILVIPDFLNNEELLITCNQKGVELITLPINLAIIQINAILRHFAETGVGSICAMSDLAKIFHKEGVQTIMDDARDDAWRQFPGTITACYSNLQGLMPTAQIVIEMTNIVYSSRINLHTNSKNRREWALYICDVLGINKA